MNIKIRTFFTLITMILIILIILLVKNINELTATTNELKDFEHNRHLMVMKSDELRQSSDDLSRFANRDLSFNKTAQCMMPILNLFSLLLDLLT